jgi:uncharacterized membrane protein (UPF0136 family)
MTLPHIQIARAHWLLGALFLAIILEEYVPLVGRDGAPQRSRSLIVPWGLMIGAVGAWATVVFADNVHDMLIHSLWGDILLAAGALELARRRGVYERVWLDLVLPLAFIGIGALFLAHVGMDSSARATPWHLAMGTLLIVGGLLELFRIQSRRTQLVPLALFPLSTFALALMAIPVAAAS